MKRTHRLCAGLGLVFAATTGCASEGAPESSTAATLAAMGSAVLDCRAERDRCEETDQAGVDCQDAFRACKDHAIDRGMPKLDQGVSACAQASQACRKSATTAEEKQACSEELELCIEDVRGARSTSDRSKDDDGNAGSPVAGCIDELRACIESDAEAKRCTDTLRGCLGDALPHHARGRDDAGSGRPDHAGRDAGTSDARECAEERKACVDSGKSPSECAQALRACRTTP